MRLHTRQTEAMRVDKETQTDAWLEHRHVMLDQRHTQCTASPHRAPSFPRRALRHCRLFGPGVPQVPDASERMPRGWVFEIEAQLDGTLPSGLPAAGQYASAVYARTTHGALVPHRAPSPLL